MRKILAITIGILLLIPGIVTANYNLFTKGYIEGYLMNITITPAVEQVPEIITVRIETYEGQFYELELDSYANLTIDNRPVSIYDYKSGMEVYGELRYGKLTNLEGYSTAVTGYIKPGSKIRQGIIAGLDRNQLKIKVNNFNLETYYFSPATIILKQGQQVTADVLYVGDKVKLYFDEIDTQMISRMEVEGNSIIVNNILKGTLQMIDTAGSFVTLEDIEVFHNGSWEKYAASSKVRFSRDLSIYIGSQKVLLHNLKYFKGKTAYIVTKPIMGKDIATRIILKNQYESTFSGKIQDINWYADMLELNNNKNVSFNDGSIIVKDGRLQDKNILQKGYDVYVLADGWGSNRLANMIYIYNQGINNSSFSQHYIYSGRLDQISQDTVWLKDFFILNDNIWESYDDTKELFYDNDTLIYDAQSRKLISIQEFWTGDYAIDEDNTRESDNKDWYAYLYTDGDRIACISLQKNMDSLLRQRITTGRVNKIEEDSLVGWNIILDDVKDFSYKKDQWMPKTSSIRLGLEDAMIIRNGQIISPEELKNLDMLYIVRDDFEAKIIVVK